MTEIEHERIVYKGFRAKTVAAIRTFTQQKNLDEVHLISNFRELINEGASVHQLAAEIGLSDTTLAKFLIAQRITLLSQTEAVRQMLGKRWEDDDFRTRSSEATRQENIRRWQDPDFRVRKSEEMRRNWQNPEFREGTIEAARQGTLRMWQDPDFRTRKTESTQQQWQDPAFRERQAERAREGLRRNKQDPVFREKTAEGIRRTRLNPENLDHYVLPSIQGQRRDLPCYSQSAWEANLARVIMICGREFLPRERFRLAIPENYQEEYQLSGDTDFSIDFLTLDRRDNFVAYEIMSHPLENPVGWLKTELFTRQYPEIRLVLVTRRFYQRLRRHFEFRMNNNPQLIGWETNKDNLRSNPQKWSA